jgi:hypothetical protein
MCKWEYKEEDGKGRADKIEREIRRKKATWIKKIMRNVEEERIITTKYSGKN